METKESITFGSNAVEQQDMLGEYLSENYEFRHNILSDCFEMRECAEEPKPFRFFSREARNSLLRKIKLTGLDISNPSQGLDEYVYSEETPLYDPVQEWLQNLPEWDGTNYVGQFFGRLPGATTEQHHFLSIWMRSTVAHWLNMDMLHGNECVVTLIGSQGCGKSTFCASILPPHLRQFYLDHIHLANKNDKEMALTNNLLVNLDELDQIKAGQHAELKQLLSKVVVNGRPIYGRAQKCRKRFASFVSTTNNPRPLSDPTGSRRYLCIRIPNGQFIDNEVNIDYEQLYAQVVYELQQGMRYWFTNEETLRIEQLNEGFQRALSLEGMLDVCFRRPEKEEIVAALSLNDILTTIVAEFPILKANEGIKVRLGKLLKAQEFQRTRNAQGSMYYIVPRGQAA